MARIEEYIVKDNKRLRLGYTTGSCAAAAAKAAAVMLLSGKECLQVFLDTPKQIRLSLEILDIRRGKDWVSCGVRKDAGDDPDITDQMVICARVSKKEEAEVSIDGGEGVGRVTKPGLDQPVGAAAINRVPRAMIEKETRAVMEEFGYRQGLHVEIFIPGGEEAAKKTFNPRLGIVGGLSVLGTSGIVEPMSEEALLDTIRAEIQVKRAEKEEILYVVPGNYGEDFFKRELKIQTEPVKCSNFVGDAIDMAGQAGFRKLLFAAHIGKFIKVSAGCMNTHSKYGDNRMETFWELAKGAGAKKELETRILDCATADEAIRILKEEGLWEKTREALFESLERELTKRGGEGMEVGALVFSNQYGLLGMTPIGERLLAEGQKKG